MSKNKRKNVAILAAAAAFGLGLHADAATRTWNNTAVSPFDWGTASNWTGGVPTSADIASIGGQATATTAVVDLNNVSYSVAGLILTPRNSTFSGQSFTIQSTGGTATLNLGGSGIVMNNGNLATIASSVTLNLTADQNWGGGANSPNVGTGLTVNGLITGAFKISLTDVNGDQSGTFTFGNAANTFSGGFTLTKRTAAISGSSTVAGGVITGGPLGTGNITLSGGTLSSSTALRTLNNNIVLSGTTNLSNTSGYSFSDAGLTVASTFSLNSATNGTVSTLRTNNAPITFDQMITESGGGTGQSLLIASMSLNSPAITINKTKSSSGNIVIGGVALVLANGAANPGAVIGVNGSITATGANKFSSGALISDNTSLIATDATNYSAVSGSRASVYNNARVSFATDQSQATWSNLFSSDSQLRIGLSSGSLSPTVTENYNQSAIGNGKTGLVSASSGTVTYNGTLTAGSDNTYRVGGGLGTLALGNALTGASSNLIVEGGGTLTSTNNNTYGGTTTVNGTTFTISGLSGTLAGTTALTINNSSTFNLTNNTSAVNANRLGDSVGVTLNNANFVLNGTSTTAASETVGNLTVNAGGRNFVTVAQTPAAATIKTLQFGTLIRNNNAVVEFRGDSLGGTGTARNEIKFSSAPTLIGGGGAAGTTTISILPWARAGTTSSAGPSTLVTYETNGIRALSTTTEFVQANNDSTARIDQAIATAGGATNYNVRAIPNTTGNATLVNTASSTVTLNSLLLDNTASTGSSAYSLNSSTINVASGALYVLQSVNQGLTVGTGTIAFGSVEGIVTSSGANNLNIATQITGSGGLSLYNLNGGSIQLSGITTSGFSGDVTIGGNGLVGVDQDQRFGNSTNNVVHAGGTLQFFSAFTSTRGLTLLGNVGNNTLANNTTSNTMIWNGNITGGGLLRLVNNASTVGTGGFSLGGASSNYSGGTQIEGINVSTTSNNALGTGTVTLIGANGNAPTLTLGGAGIAPTLGGLRGTDGTVTVTTTDAGNAATLTIGANNDNTVFNGVIAQGSGKTASVTKAGTGILVLGGNETYTGATVVNGGSLIVNGSLAASTPGVTVNSTATLGGTGLINAPVAVVSGGTLSPGNSPGAITVAGNLTLAGGAHLRTELAKTAAHSGLNAQVAGTDYDQVIVKTGTTTDVTGADLVLTFDSTIQNTEVFYIVDNQGANAITGTFATGSINGVTATGSFAQGGIFTAGGFQFSISYLASAPSSSIGNDIALTAVAVPEPTGLCLMGLGAGAMLARRRRHKLGL